MNKQRITLIALAALAAIGAGAGLYWLGMQRGMSGMEAGAPAKAEAPPTATQPVPQGIAEGEEATRRHISSGLKAGDVDPANGRRILYYHDPMVPGNKFDKPGKSPYMDMMLVPVYADSDADQGRVTVSPRIQQNLGLRTAEVTEGMLSPQLRAVGSIAFNEREQAIVQARAGGFIERLDVRATLDRVAKGQSLAEVYVPDWIAAQEEYLAVQRMQGSNLAPLLDGARARMRQAGMSEDLIQRVEAAGRPLPRIAITAPISGLVTEIGAREGMAVLPGATLFRINGFESVWAHAEVPESQAALLRPGAKVTAQIPAAPGVKFEGRVQTLLPSVEPATRTLKARVELANARGLLVPGMSVTMAFTDLRPDKAILVPSEALIATGRRTVVMLAEENGRFRPVEVQVGIESGGQTEIKRGLQPGQRVVVSSQFLIDSEASLRGLEARLNAEPPPPAPAPLQRHRGEAKVISVDAESALLQHGPLPTAGMGAMTMEFKAPEGGMPPNLAEGDEVEFEFVWPKGGEPQLTRITPKAKAPRAGASR